MSVRFTLDLARSPHLDPVPDKSGSRGCDRHGSGARFWEVAPCPVAQVYTHSWREHIRAVSAVLRRHRPRGGRRVDRSIADTACSSKPLCGPMGIEWVNGAKGGGAGEGKCNELRRWSAIGRRKERWHGVAGEVMRSRPKGSGHTAAEADMTAGFVLVDGSRCSSSSS